MGRTLKKPVSYNLDFPSKKKKKKWEVAQKKPLLDAAIVPGQGHKQNGIFKKVQQ